MTKVNIIKKMAADALFEVNRANGVTRTVSRM